MTNTQMVQLVCTSVLFITVILAGVFSVEVCGMWLRNRREERRNTVRDAEQRMSDRYDKERASWLAIIQEKDKQIAGLNAMVARLEKGNDIANRILKNAEIRKESI